MKFFSPASLLALALSAAQVVQSSVFFSLRDGLNQDECMVRHFGAATNNESLISIVEDAPYSKIIDAFIECPAQMSEAYCGKLFRDKPDRLVRYLRDSASDKMDQFYAALRDIPVSEHFMRHGITRNLIYCASFINDIPKEYFVNELKNENSYLDLLIEKANRSKTPEAKASVTVQLKESLTKLAQGPSNENTIHYMDLIEITLKLMNNEDLDLETFDADSSFGLLFMALSHNRYDIAERLTSTAAKTSRKLATNFLLERAGEYPDDVPRAVEILKKIMPTDADRNALERRFRTN